jgi:hypothetical protein
VIFTRRLADVGGVFLAETEAGLHVWQHGLPRTTAAAAGPASGTAPSGAGSGRRPSAVGAPSTSPRRYLELLDRLYRAVATVAGPGVIVDASKHVSHAFLLRRVPGLDLRVVHLVRDSRGVALSWTRLRRRPEVLDGQAMMATRPPVLLSVRWLTHNALFHLLRRLGVPTLLLRYESLVRCPAAELTRVLAHASQPAAAGELGFHRRRLGAARNQPRPCRQPDAVPAGRLPLGLDEEWRHQLSRGQRLVIVGSTWPLLRRYGYLRRSPR